MLYHLANVYVCPSGRRARPVIPLPFGKQNITRLVSGLLPQVSNDLRDLGQSPLRKADLHRSTARRLLAAKTASHQRTALHPRLSMFGVETPRGATPARCLSICHPQQEHLPSSSIVPPVVTPSTLTGSGLPGCPQVTGLEAEKQGCSPFPCLSTGSSDDARPP